MQFSRTQLATMVIEVMIVVRLLLAFVLTAPSVPSEHVKSRANETSVYSDWTETSASTQAP
jgi:hypothetical protein